MVNDSIPEQHNQANSDEYETIIRQAAPIRCSACECLVGLEDESCVQCGALLVTEGWCVSAQEVA